MHIADTVLIVMIFQKKITIDQIRCVLDIDNIDSNFILFYMKHTSARANIKSSTWDRLEKTAFLALLSLSCKIRMTWMASSRSEM